MARSSGGASTSEATPRSAHPFALLALAHLGSDCGATVQPAPRPSPDGECDYGNPFGVPAKVFGAEQL